MDAAAHVLVFPWPLQGHINCMLHLAAALLDAGLHVTFLHTDHNLRRLASQPASSSPRLRLLSIPDGLPDDHPRSVAHLNDLMDSMRATGSAAYRALVLASSSNRAAYDDHPPVTCVIADGVMAFAIDVAEEIGVPAIAFRTASACSFLAYLSMRRLVELGEAPFPSDQPVSGVPGMEGFLRRRDLPRAPSRPSTSTAADDSGVVDPMLLNMGDCSAHSGKARALILNTSASMEAAALAHIAPHMSDVFAVGPLHAAAGTTRTASLWREDDGCIAWLDGHEDRSVVYVSLGSLTVISEEQLAEFLSGLAATGYAFIWVLRPDMVAGGTAVKMKILGLGGDKYSRVVEWAPQRDILRHRAVGCFLTHAGWNSTLEAAYEGVPMVCWTFFGDQLVNSRFVDTVWKTGVDIKDVCDRAFAVERAVRQAMESAEIRAAAQDMARQLRLDVAQGGSSSSQIKRLVAFIGELYVRDCHHTTTPADSS
ncbi:myricetin 3-O-rhamnoside 1,2-glucosyltransferase UGT709G2-like [Lolium rigidum]|uniref:myricetin 3-O-rhamnoside 1,2-glucosyltransferase UGT709G2-like n=1 Tax=Lolium rigidum TaxID=89674 RepID=UPI001F5C4469|nr:myricetin 3-O-rhamnoside 1,2-glucosyltransferase UGT709G2-like [Lolium rigidum]